MNLFRSSSTRLAVCLAFGSFLASTAAAQRVISTPYALENGGLIDAIWWDVTGGQDAAETAARKNRYLSMSPGGARLFGNKPIYDWISANLAGTPSTYSCTMVRGGPRQTTSQDGSFSHHIKRMMLEQVVLPGGNAGENEARDMTMTAVPESIEKDPTYAPNPNLNMMARKQKSWLCSNFRVRLGNLPCSRVSQYDPIVFDFRPGGDLDGDGAPDEMEVRVRDVGFEIPDEDSAMFIEEFRKSQSGSPTDLPFTVEYLDDDGLLVVSMSMTVFIRSVGPSDIFVDPLVSKQKQPVTVTVSHRGTSRPLVAHGGH